VVAVRTSNMGHRNGLVLRYYAFKVTNTAGFYLPVYFLFLRDQGYALAFLGLVSAAFSYSLVAVEIPTGYIGDLIGRRGSLAVGAVVRAGVVAAYPFAGSKTAYLALHALWAVGWAFRSGTQDAWLYEVLKSTCDEDEYARIDGRANSLLLVVSAATAIAGGFMYTIEPAAPFLANAAVALAGLPILYTFPAVETDGDDETFGFRDAIVLLRAQTRRREIRYFVAYAAVFAAVFAATRPFEQPMLRSVGVPIAGLGVLYAGFKLVSAGAAASAGVVEDRLGVRGTFAVLPAIYGFVFAVVLVVPVAIVPVVFLNRAIRTVTRPIQNKYLNDRLDDVGRATVLSGASMALSVVSGTGKLVNGHVTDALGAIDGVAVAGVGAAGLGALIWLATDPVRDHGRDADARSDDAVDDEQAPLIGPEPAADGGRQCD
jgi:MFS family permease